MIVTVMAVSALIVSVFAAGRSYIRGDADCDQKLTILDTTTIQRMLAAMPVGAFDEKAADIDGNGLDILDATHIQRCLAGYSDPYDIGVLVTESPTEKDYELPFVPA